MTKPMKKTAAALRKLNKTMAAFAKNEATVEQLSKVTNAFYKAFNEESYDASEELREGLWAEFRAVNGQRSAADDSARAIRQAARAEQIRALDSAASSDALRYVPGIGYAKGGRVIA